jgi:hypothetical protein
LSSVSGRVKNWGACGSIAPPMTVDIMVETPDFTRPTIRLAERR